MKDTTPESICDIFLKSNFIFIDMTTISKSVEDQKKVVNCLTKVTYKKQNKKKTPLTNATLKEPNRHEPDTTKGVGNEEIRHYVVFVYTPFLSIGT